MLGLMLLVAAGLKAHQLATDPFVTLAHRSPLPSGEGWVRALTPAFLHSRPFLIAVVECELLFGLVLLSGILPRLTWALALLCFGGFALVSLYKGISGESTCGCFGRVPVNPWYTFTLDAFAVLALLRWRPRGQSRSHVLTSPRSAGVLAVWLVVGTPVALATWSAPVGTLTDLGELLPDGKTVLLKPETWIGKRLPLLGHIDSGSLLDASDWIVVLYRRDCARCQILLSELESPAAIRQEHEQMRHAALINIAPHATGSVKGLSRFLHAKVDNRYSLLVETPVTLVLKDGRVVECSYPRYDRGAR
jgi:hypothetical protein